METSFIKNKPNKSIGLSASPLTPDVLANELRYMSEKTTQSLDCDTAAATNDDDRVEGVASQLKCCSINDICYLQDSNSDEADDDEQVIVVSLSSSDGCENGGSGMNRLADDLNQRLMVCGDTNGPSFNGTAMTMNRHQQQHVDKQTESQEHIKAKGDEAKKCCDMNSVNSVEAFQKKYLQSSVKKVNAILPTSTTTTPSATYQNNASTASIQFVYSPLSLNHTSHESTKTAITTSQDVQNVQQKEPLFKQNPSSQQQQEHHQHSTNTNAKQWQQYPFVKSQSLDIVGNEQQTTLIYQMHHNLLFQLAEDHQQEEEKGPKMNEEVMKPPIHKSPITSIESIVHSQDSKLPILESRPIYPNIPYSPYASPRSNRRRPPLRESRRISIEKSGSFLQLNQYKLMDQIGQGSYGLVKLAYSEEDSTHYAMKILSKRRLLRQAGLMKRGPKKQSMSPLDRVYREIAVLKKLDHPNVVKLIEVLDDPMEDSLYMVFEWVQKGEVLRIPTNEPLSETRAWSVFRDTLLGLEYLHYQRIVHADLKPSNLLLTDCDHVKIADLGVCNEFLGEDAKMSNGCTAGTPAFRAPETLQLGQYVYCGKAADIWALGVTLYSLVYGVVPFPVTTVPVLYENIKRDPIKFPERPKVSETLKDCILRMLTKDPEDRITLPQLKEHPWVTSDGSALLPSEEENCRLVQIDDEDMNSVVRSIPKLDTLILIKTMLKNHSFGNPFLKGGSSGISGRAPQRGGSRLERFVRAGRSNSAPGAYTNPMDRQYSADNLLPSLYESSSCANNDDA